MKAASAPRAASDVRVLEVDGARMRVLAGREVSALFLPGDLLVVNDAATLPAALPGEVRGAPLEVRLAAGLGDRRWTAALLGPGDHLVRTEDRAAPPRVEAGDVITLGADLRATVARVHAASPRLVDVDLAAGDGSLAAIWAAIYRHGRPVQYAHVPAPIALWDVQNVYAGRPWAVEMPSAGRVLTAEVLRDLAWRGVALARVTHGAGLSSIGDASLDALLPLPERWEVKEETWAAIDRARRAGGRIVAVGTSVVRALESAVRAGGRESGVTDLRFGPGSRRAVVDAVLTGMHEVETSHFSLLAAFALRAVLDRATARAEAEGFLGHEHGDLCLVWGQLAGRATSGVRTAEVTAAR